MRFGEVAPWYPYSEGIGIPACVLAPSQRISVERSPRDPAPGRKVSDLCRDHGISQETFYRWRRKYGGMEVDDAKRLMQLEDENRKLNLLAALGN